MTDMDYSKYDEAFENAEEPLLGAFVARVKSLKWRHSRNGDKPMVVWALSIEEGEHTGKGFNKYSVFSTSKRIMGLIKHELKLVGVPWSKPESLAMNLQQGEGSLVMVTRKRKEEYINTYIDKRLDEPKKADEMAPF